MKLLISIIFGVVLILQVGCAQGGDSACAAAFQSCIEECQTTNTEGSEDALRCQFNCSQATYACIAQVERGGEQVLFGEDENIEDIEEVEDIKPLPPVTKEQWSYVSIAGMTLIAGGVTATIFCGLNPVCLASAAAAVGLANYKYQILLRGATLYENGVISAVRGVSSYAFGAAVGTAKNKLNPTVSRPDSLSNEDRINDFNKALMDELAHFYNLWR